MTALTTAALLEEAERLATALAKYRAKEEAKHFPELAQRAHQLDQALRQRLDIVRRPTPHIAFVAHKGVGKSTLINALAGLWLEEAPPAPDATSKQLNQRAVLPLGNGGTTPCEIRVEAGAWEVRVDPEPTSETLAQLRQFAEWAWHKVHDPKKGAGDASSPADEGSSDSEELPITGRPPRLQPDIERVVRGIVGLPEHYIAGSAAAPSRGKRPAATLRDEADELARSFPTKIEFVAEVERRARLGDRQRLQWLPTGDARRWLRETLLNLIEGKFDDQPFPKRIIVRTPSTGVRWASGDLPLIDTLGLPAVASGRGDGEPSSRSVHPLAEREDLRHLLKEPWALIVVGAQFNEPPAPSAELLQQMMEEAIFFGETLADRTVVAIVDPGKAGSGNFDDAETERTKKEDRCAENMVRLGCPRGPEHPDRWTVDSAKERVFCVNVLDGGTEPFQDFLAAAVERMVGAHQTRLSAAVAEANSFFRNLGDAKRQAIHRVVVAAFKHYLSVVAQKQVGKARAFRSNLLHPLADECRFLHPSTLRSVIVRRGRGATQNAWAMLESATTRELTRLLEPISDNIDITAEVLQAEEKYQEEAARAVIDEEADRRRRIVENFIMAYVANLVDASRTQLLDDTEIWEGCDGEWGRGIKDPGYKERIARRFEQWGVDHSPELLGELHKVQEFVAADDTGMLRSLTET